MELRLLSTRRYRWALFAGCLSVALPGCGTLQHRCGFCRPLVGAAAPLESAAAAPVIPSAIPPRGYLEQPPAQQPVQPFPGAMQASYEYPAPAPVSAGPPPEVLMEMRREIEDLHRKNAEVADGLAQVRKEVGLTNSSILDASSAVQAIRDDMAKFRTELGQWNQQLGNLHERVRENREQQLTAMDEVEALLAGIITRQQKDAE